MRKIIFLIFSMAVFSAGKVMAGDRVTFTPKTIPGMIEAESLDASTGGPYANGTYVAGIGSGSTMSYDVNVQNSGTYDISFRYATTYSGVQFQVTLGSASGTVSLPSTGSWGTWNTVTLTNISLTAGNGQTLVIQSTGVCNFDWMDWVLQGGSTAPTANAGSNQTITLPTNQVSLTGSGTASALVSVRSGGKEREAVVRVATNHGVAREKYKWFVKTLQPMQVFGKKHHAVVVCCVWQGSRAKTPTT